MATSLTQLLLAYMLPSASREKGCGYGREDIFFGKFYKAATGTNRRFLREVLKILFYRTRVFILQSWPDNVEDYCFDILEWSRKKYRDSFNAEERKYLATALDLFEGDVTLLYKIIIKLFGDVDLSQTFSSGLRDLKNVRNRVCHDQLEFSETSLTTYMEDLKNIFRNMIYELRSIFSIDLSGMECQFCDEVDEIMAASITGEGSSYFDNMERFRDDLMGKFITHGRKELFLFYSKLKVLNPFTWLRDDKFSELQVDKIFTPLQLSNHDVSVDIEALLVTEPYDEDTMEPTGVLPPVIILNGVAGSGKTSLCRYLLHEWRTGLTRVINLRSVDILIFIEIRNIVTNSLVNFLKHNILRETCSHFEEKDILTTLQNLNVLYVVDGVDEATGNARELLIELLSVLGNSRVIFTTRPESTAFIVESILSHHLTFLNLQIHGFSDAGITKFTSKVLQCLEGDEEKRRRQEEEFLTFMMKTGKRLGYYHKIPLIVALMIILYTDEKACLTNITSVTKLYSEIFKMCSTKLLSRVRKSMPSSCLDLDNFMEKWLLKLSEIAYDMVRQDEYVITDESRRTLISLCNEYGVDSIQVLSAFLMCEVHEDLDGIKHTFTFIHKSQMEYLAGYYHALGSKLELEQKCKNLSENVKSKTFLAAFEMFEEKEVYKMTEIGKLMNMYLFTIGHLCMQKPQAIDLVCKMVVKILSIRGLTRNFGLLGRLVEESEHHPAVCKLVSDSISKKFLWQPSDEELCNPMGPVLYIFKYTDFMPFSVRLRIVGNKQGTLIKGDDEKAVLKPYKNLKTILQCIGQKPETNLTLEVDQHLYNWGNPEESDVFLEELPSNTCLTAFMGHLGVGGAKLIELFKKLKVLNVRISNPDTLHALDESIGNNREMPTDLAISIRLDISEGLVPSNLPKLSNLPPFDIIMINISDDKVEWTSEILAQLTNLYKGVQLLSSTLTAEGGNKLLSSLSDKNVEVKEIISIHTFNRPSEDAMCNLREKAKCHLEWW